MDVSDAECEQGQQNDDGLLLIPGDVIDDGQLIYIAESQGITQHNGGKDKGVGVVALSGIQHAGYPVDVAQIESVVAVFGASSREDDTVFGQIAGEVSVVLSTAHTAVAAGHDHEFAYRSVLDSLEDSVGELLHLSVCETADEAAFVNRCGWLASLCHSDDGGKVLPPCGVGGDVRAAGVPGGIGGEDAVAVRSVLPDGHDAV